MPALCDLSPAEIEYGFNRALRRFIPGYGINFPAPGMIRDWCTEERDATPDDAPRILNRPALPEDTETPEQRAEYSRKLTEAMRSASKALAMPTYQETAESRARERNGPTKVPADPAERRKWHTAKYSEMKARETAQMIREPGDEDD